VVIQEIDDREEELRKSLQAASASPAENQNESSALPLLP
jgi:hypothetical protein